MGREIVDIDARPCELIVGDGALAVTDLVVMKVLAGARDDLHADRDFDAIACTARGRSPRLHP